MQAIQGQLVNIKVRRAFLDFEFIGEYGNLQS